MVEQTDDIMDLLFCLRNLNLAWKQSRAPIGLHECLGPEAEPMFYEFCGSNHHLIYDTQSNNTSDVSLNKKKEKLSHQTSEICSDLFVLIQE